MATPAQPAPAPLTDAELTELGRAALNIEAAAVSSLAGRLGLEFARACRICLACRGRVVVIGMGKSGHIGNKIAATFASTGTPAFFVHPAEAVHGDIGMITQDDVVITLSNSGETSEVLALVPALKRLGVPVISLTGNPASALARIAAVHLDVSVPAEACPLNLAPTASTTATLAMGDALAVALLRLRGFTEADFARSHPGGSLGRRLLLHVADVMHAGSEVPAVGPDATVSAGLLEMSRKGLGMTSVVAADGKQAAGRVHRRRPAPHARSPDRRARNADGCGDDLAVPLDRPTRTCDRGRADHGTAPDYGTGGCRQRRHRGRSTQRARSAARGGHVSSELTKRIRLLILDVDGVMTDGRLWFGPDGEIMKAFHVRDGVGIKAVLGAGIEVAIISGRRSAAVERRAMELGIRHVRQGCDNKAQVLRELLAELGVASVDAACVVDDTPDLPMMAIVALPIAVADAHPDVVAAARHVTVAAGGCGAVREACDMLIDGRT